MLNNKNIHHHIEKEEMITMLVFSKSNCITRKTFINKSIMKKKKAMITLFCHQQIYREEKKTFVNKEKKKRKILK
jgi:hypothetical protein